MFSDRANRTASPQRSDAQVSPVDERVLVERVRVGDHDAFAQIFRLYGARLASYAHSIVHSREVAEEVVQDCFFAIWQRREQWFVEGALTSYLHISVRNTAINVLRRRQRQHQLHLVVGQDDEPLAMASPAPDIAEQIEDEELATQVRNAIDTLSDQQRTIVRMRLYDGLTHPEIAKILGIAVRTSENHVVRALQKLRRILTRD